MYFVESASYDPYVNLAIEEFLFTHLPKGCTCFMLWQNDNTVVVGNYQNTMEEIDPVYVRKHGIKVVRRLSGGGAVYHDLQNLNYTFITDEENLEKVSFDTFVMPLVRTLRGMGLDASFTGRNDVTIGGKKICGNSQKISRGRILHHGCIMLGTDLSKVSGALTPRKGVITSGSTKSVRSGVTTINSCLNRPVSMEQFKRLLVREVERDTVLEPYPFSLEEAVEIVRLSENKYSTWEWNYGKSPAFNLEREKKYPEGLVIVRMRVQNGTIEEIRFYGDFFAVRDITELEEKLRGRKLDAGFMKALEESEAGSYIRGIGSGRLYELIMME